MPFIDINGANLYYETFGDDKPGVPIVLIHGSTIDSHTDWAAIAPLLARRYRVIVPDCRGHGRSSSTHSYSFKEMAADTAALIRVFGYERAHLIGHSNGGNVVLVTLLEHPDVVQTCIPQAANAYVSQDLIDKEPPLFDPDRVARDAPDWMNEMIRLHGPTHGPDYWRELLQLTLKELISGPNYTSDDLSKVTRPVLVIQGGNDGVNAPSHHAEFIADHIPDAECWIPPGIGHNVHFEHTLEWIARVFDFLKRRGDDASDALYRLCQHRYADPRDTIFDVHCSPLPTGEGLGVRGQVLTGDQHVQLRAALGVLPAQPVDDQVRVLLTSDTPYALINRSVADVRREPRAGSEQLTQLLIGEVVRVLDEQGEWSLIRVERDGYLGWARTQSLQRCDRKTASRYQASAKAIVCGGIVPAYDRPSSKANLIGKLPFCAMLPVVDEKTQFKAVRLPDDRVWWVKSSDLMPRSQRPKPARAGITFALDLMRQFLGTPYQWGGCSPFGYDCSGFAQTFHRFMGVSIPRDADQQFRDGAPVMSTPQAGDLLYFGGAGDDDGPQPRYGHVTHVAISLGGDELIHANGTTWSIAYNSLDPGSPIYRAWLKDHLLGVRRFR
jgi:pimeloyl-ACP methyl ester carboxylesterase/cell wall-associated NlpC family hydrolase